MSVQTQDTLHPDCEHFFASPTPNRCALAVKPNSDIATYAVEGLTKLLLNDLKIATDVGIYSYMENDSMSINSLGGLF